MAAKKKSINIKHPGKLHRDLHIPADKPIPMRTLQRAKAKAKKNHDTALLKEIQFALNSHKFSKG